MKKTSLSLLTVISLFAFSACASKDPISQSKAMEYAAKDAGFETSEVTFTEQSYDKDDNQYDFTFHTSTEKFEYEIDGNKGDVISKSKEAMKNTGATNNGTTNNGNTTNDTNTGSTTDATGNNLNEEQWTFLNQALTHFQVSKDEISGVKVEMDTENGVATYDIEFYKGQAEYSCEIQIDNKAILSSDIDQN